MINEDDKKIVDEVLEDFAGLARIPRPSLHEKAVSDWIKGWAEERGLEVMQDDIWDLIIRKPASAGYDDHKKSCLSGPTR